MKLPELLRYSLLATLALTTAASCKKKDDSPTCRIITVTDSYTSSGTTNNTSYNITYNNDGKISTLTSSNGSTTTQKIFNYNSNTVIINATQGGTFSGRDSVSLNGSGRITNIRSFSNSSGTNWYNNSYEYDGNGNLLKSVSSSSSSSSTSTTTFSSTNGDVTSGNDGSSTTTYEYYTDKSYQVGDYFQIVYFINYGTDLVKNKHLLKSITSSGSINNCNYEFTDGRITKLTLTSSSSVEAITYQYQCN